MSDISSNASTLSQESTDTLHTLHKEEAIVTRALVRLGDESGHNRWSSSGILSGSDSQVERLTELLNRTKVNFTHSCVQCNYKIALLLLSSVWNLIFLFPIWSIITWYETVKESMVVRRQNGKEILQSKEVKYLSGSYLTISLRMSSCQFSKRYFIYIL